MHLFTDSKWMSSLTFKELCLWTFLSAKVTTVNTYIPPTSTYSKISTFFGCYFTSIIKNSLIFPENFSMFLKNKLYKYAMDLQGLTSDDSGVHKIVIQNSNSAIIWKTAILLKFTIRPAMFILQPVAVYIQPRWKENCCMHLLIKKLGIFSPQSVFFTSLNS